MIKKLALTLVATAMLMLPLFSTSSIATDSKSAVIDSGLMKSNRILIPLRAVSQDIGAGVNWYQEEKIIKITKSNTEIIFFVNFKRVLVNKQRTDFDAPVELINNSTYVPLRFVSETLGADVKWNQQANQATINVDGKNIIVRVKQPAFQPSASKKITDARLKAISDRLNQVGDLSGVKNLRNTYKPYFTDSFINSLIKNKGTGYVHQFGAPETGVNYINKTTASFMQSLVMGNTLTGENHYVLDRQATLIYTAGSWKVDKVAYSIREIPNLGLES